MAAYHRFALARVLVIDDSPVMHRLVAATLRFVEVQLDGADDGPAGLLSATEKPPDVIVLDLGLPLLDGWQVLERLKANPNTGNIPILILTGMSVETAQQRAKESGASAFMTKPFKPEELRRTIISLLEQARIGWRGQPNGSLAT